MRLSKTATYKVRDVIPASIQKQCHRQMIRAQWTGEQRPPRKGEWYLSGAIIEAYRAPNDLTTPYHIAELVEIRMVEQVVRALKEPASLSQVVSGAANAES